MTRAKYTKPPGPFPGVEQIQRSKFRFRNAHWQRLAKLLPPKLNQLTARPDYVDQATKLPYPPGRTLKTVADEVIHETEALINSFLTMTSAGPQITGAQVRAAIREVRATLKHLKHVDSETADIIPGDLDSKLEARDLAIARSRLGPAQQRALEMLCRSIVIVVGFYDETIGEQDMLRYVDAALNFARVRHPDISKYRIRLKRLCFPMNEPPHSLG